MSEPRMRRTFRYRLSPNGGQARALGRMLAVFRELYNAALEERREAWSRCRIGVSFVEQCRELTDVRRLRPDLRVYSRTAAEQTLRRLDKAFDAFFRRVKAGEQSGYPRFKSRSRFRSVRFRYRKGCHIRDGRLYLQGIGNIRVRWHREIPPGATIKSVVVKEDRAGRWFASFQVELPAPDHPVAHDGPAVGVDLGLASLVALSNGETVDSPRHFQQASAKLRRQQRRMSRRRRGSAGYRGARRQVAKTRAAIADQRRDFLHRLSRDLVDRFSLIAVEDLNVKGLARSRLAKPIHDAAWSTLVAMLEYKAESAGSRVVRVDPRGTSQACSGCGCVVKKGLEVRVHRCPDCGLELDRDVNAARNVLCLALSPPERGGRPSTWPEVRASVGREAA